MSDLLAQLRGEGEVEARGRFSIDTERAREKLRQYQLADPHRYVLLLVESAVQSGAERIEFELDSDDVHMRFRGRAYDPQALQDIYGALFLDPADLDAGERAGLRAVQLLAYALNSAMALNPRWVRVVSVDDHGNGARLELRGDEDDVEAIVGGEPGTHIHVRDRFRPGLVVEFFRRLGNTLAEGVLLRAHCMHASVPILIGGEPISETIRPPRRVSQPEHEWRHAPVLEGGLTIGWGWLSDAEAETGVPATADVCSNGVLVETLELREAIPGFVARVDSRALRKDVSQSQLLRDAGFDALVSALMACHDQLVQRLAERATDPTLGAPGYADRLLRTWLLVRVGRFPGKQLPKALRDQTDPTRERVLDAPIWPLVSGGPTSTRALLEADGPVPFATRKFDFGPVEIPIVVAAYEGPWLADELQQLFGAQTSNFDGTLARLHERERARLAFLTRVHPAVLPRGAWWVREAFDTTTASGGRVHGEVGVRYAEFGGGWIRLVVDGCLLGDLDLAEVGHAGQALAGVCVVLNGPFAADDSYTEATADDALLEALLVAVDRVGRAFTTLAHDELEAGPRPNVRTVLEDYVEAVGGHDFAGQLIRAFGFSRGRLRERTVRDALAAAVPDWRLDAADPDEVHPLARVPLFERAGGEPLSLVELRRRQRAGEAIAWLEPSAHAEGTELLQAGRALGLVFDEPVVRLSSRARVALRNLLGDDALESFSGRLASLRRRVEFMAKPTVQPSLGTTLATLEFRRQGARGVVGLARFELDAVKRTQASVSVLYHGRELCTLSVEVGVPGVSAWIDGEGFAVESNYRRLSDPTEVARIVQQAAVDLVARMVDRARDAPTAQPRCVWWLLGSALVTVFGRAPTGLAKHVWTLLPSMGLDGALAELDGLLSHHETHPPRDVSRAIGRARGRGQQPTAQAVADSLSRPSRRIRSEEVDAARYRRRLLAVAKPILELPLFRGLEGGSIDDARRWRLVDVLGQLERDEPIAWVEEGFGMRGAPTIETPVLGLDPIERRTLEAVVGQAALENIGPWLQGRARFERRRTIRELRIPGGAVVGTIPFEAPGIRGQLGLARDVETTRSRVRVIYRDRELTTVDFPARPLAILGVVAMDDPNVLADHSDLTHAEQVRVIDLVQGHQSALFDDLATRFETASDAQRPTLAAMVVHALRRWPGGARFGRRSRSAGQEPFATLARLPVFTGARKPWSAFELAEAANRGPLPTIDYRSSQDLPDGPVLVLTPPGVESALRDLFGDLRDLTREANVRRELERRRQSAPELPATPPADALVSLALGDEIQGLEGWLAVLAGSRRCTIAVGEDGRQVQVHELSVLYPVAGAVWGPGVRVNAEWTAALISRPRKLALEQRSVAVWSALIDRFEAWEAAGVPTDRGGRQRFQVARRALHEQFMRLHQATGRAYLKRRLKGKRPNGREQRMYARLTTLRLIELRSGRWISAETADRERPIELAPLELWRGPSAEELAHRRELERARKREAAERRARDNERAREQARRRAAEREARDRDRAKREQERAQREAQARREERQAERERRKREREHQARRERERAQARTRAERASARTKAEPETAVGRLLDAVCNELRLVRGRRTGLVSDHHLDAIELGREGSRSNLFTWTGRVVVVNVDHALFRGVLERADDPAWISLLASTTYTYLNLVYEEIEDEDEARFLAEHAGHIASAVDGL